MRAYLVLVYTVHHSVEFGRVTSFWCIRPMQLVIGKVYQRAQEAGESAAVGGHLVKTADAVMSISGTSPRPARYMCVRRSAAATSRPVKICLLFTSAVSAGRP